MKRIVSVFAVLMMVAGSAIAMPSMYGSYGLVRTIAPDNAGAMNFGIGFRGFLAMNEVDSTYSWMNIDVYPEGYFAFSDMFELSVAPGYRFNQGTETIAGVDSSTWRNGGLDTRIGLKASFKMSESFDLGAYLGYDYRSSRKYSYYAWVNDAWEKDSNYTSTGAIHFTLIPGIKADKFKAHLNLGMAMNLDKYENAAGDNLIYPNIGIPFGLGMSYDAGMVTPFMEVTGRAGIDSIYYKEYDATMTVVDSVKRGIMNNPFWVTGGLRFAFGDAIKMDIGGEMNFQTDDTTHMGLAKLPVDWQVFMGLAYAPTKASGPKVPPTGIISGKVVDKAGKGLAAMVMAGGITANTDPATGAYTLSGVLIDKAPVEIKADAKGYIAKQASIMLTKKNKKKPAMQDFTLELKPIPASDVTGIITNYKDGSPMAGVTINFKGPKAVTAKTDAAGKYTAKLEQGNYQAVVSADGFKDKAFSVVAKDGKPAAQNIALVKQKETFAFADIYFPSGKAAITPKAEAKLEGLYKVLSDNPELKVEIAGHTDGLGSNRVNLKLSQSRAEAVKTWLEAKGIAADKLVAKGYGEDKPIASNKTRDGRAQNRRIEINVLD